MREASLIWTLLSICVGFSCLAETSPQSIPRIALLEPKGEGWFDLLVSSLSQHNELTLVDRDLLSEAFFERALSEARSGFLENANPESADGLLLIEKHDDAFELRLFSTHHGLRIWSGTVAEPSQEAADELAVRIAAAARKLMPEGGALFAVGVLAFRPVSFSPDRQSAAQMLVRLTEAAVQTNPGMVALERRDLGKAAFERSLRSDNARLRFSTLLIDGSLDRINGEWTLDLRVQSPDGGKPKVTHLSDPDLANLAAQIVAQVGGNVSDPNHRAAEAEVFFREAQRLERQKLDSAALRAAETAEVLGLRNESLTRLLAVLHARHVVMDPRFHGGVYLREDPVKPTEIYHHAMASLDYCERLERSRAPLTEVITASSEFLKTLDRENPANLDTESLRVRLRALAPFDPSAKEPPWHLAHAADYAPTWADSPEEAVAFYENWLRSGHPQRLWVAKRLLGDPARTLGERFPDKEKNRRLMRELIGRLKADPRLELTGLMLEFGMDDPQSSPGALRSYYKKFVDRAADLETNGEFEPLVDAEIRDTGRLTPFAAERAQRLLRVLPVLTSLQNQFLYQEFQAEYPPDAAQKIWQAFTAYRERLLAAGKDVNETTRLLAHLGAIFLQRNPQAKSTDKPQDNAISVRKFWIMPGGSPDRERYTTWALPVEDGIWLSAGWRTANTDSQFWHVQTPSLESRCLEVPGRVATAQFAVTDDAIFGVYGEYPGRDRPMEYEVGRGDLASGTWQFRPIRPVYQIFAPGHEELVFNLWTPGGRKEENGLLLYHWQTGREDLLASSLRHPQKTPLDQVADASMDAVCRLPNGRLLVNQRSPLWQVLSVDPEDASFEVMLRGPKLEAFPQSDGLLLAGQLGEVWHFDGERLVCWIGPEGRWPKPAVFNHDIISEHRIASHDGRLFFLSRAADGRFRLHILADDLPEGADGFPLHFDTSAHPDPADDVFSVKLFATRSGLVILPLGRGFWFLDYNDIPGWRETYRRFL